MTALTGGRALSRRLKLSRSHTLQIQPRGHCGLSKAAVAASRAEIVLAEQEEVVSLLRLHPCLGGHLRCLRQLQKPTLLGGGNDSSNVLKKAPRQPSSCAPS